MAGRKSEALLDSIDLNIIQLLSRENPNEPTKVLELAKKIGLTHQNTKKHLEKLIKAKLIIAQMISHNSIHLTTVLSYVTQRDFKELHENGDINDTEYENFKNNIKGMKFLVEKLNEIESIDSEKQTLATLISEINSATKSKK